MNTLTAVVPVRRLAVVALAVNLYVQLSELVRYLAVVQPLIQDELSMIDGVARIDAVIFPIWGLWGTLLSGLLVWLYWMTAQSLGPSLRTAVISGGVCWLAGFVILWVGVANMQLTSWTIPAVALPLALVEMVTAAMLARWLLHGRRVERRTGRQTDAAQSREVVS